VVRPADGEMLTTDGPFAEGKEHLGGFTIIQAPDLDAALEWGRKLARVTTLPIEVLVRDEACTEAIRLGRLLAQPVAAGTGGAGPAPHRGRGPRARLAHAGPGGGPHGGLLASGLSAAKLLRIRGKGL
jgi:YCII-related domain-containing protein